MAMQPVDYKREILNAISNSTDLPTESSSPLEHYRRSANDAWNLVVYVKRNVTKANYYPKSFDGHRSRLHAMCMASIVGAFERFLKELSVVCVNNLKEFSLDARLDEFSLKGSVVAAHFNTQSVGNALCEADTWLNLDTVNKKFRKLLADPFEDGSFYVFPMKTQHGLQDAVNRSQLILAVFQLRHTLVHNLGVITESDATKLRRILQAPIEGNKVLRPSSWNVVQVKKILDEATKDINLRMAIRLAELLEKMHQESYMIVDPASKAQELATLFRTSVTICGHAASPLD
jgi:hypothetical protein